MTLLMLVVGRSSNSAVEAEDNYGVPLEADFAEPEATASSTSALKILPLGPEP